MELEEYRRNYRSILEDPLQVDFRVVFGDVRRFYHLTILLLVYRIVVSITPLGVVQLFISTDLGSAIPNQPDGGTRAPLDPSRPAL